MHNKCVYTTKVSFCDNGTYIDDFQSPTAEAFVRGVVKEAESFQGKGLNSQVK